MAPLRPCGTEAAYQRHLKLGEQPCEACKAAHAAEHREYIARNPDREWRRRNPEKARVLTRNWQRKNRERYREQKRLQAMVRRHGLNASEAFAEFWSLQDGRCYLCGDDLQRESAQIDHDHVCCPRNKTCDYCRRGLACAACNVIIAQARDDPDRLRRIADNFQPVLAATRARITAKPEQQTLLLGVMR